ncbi:hypothetical protein ACFY3M_27975 [Streptomyces mirabilis]|uniref:hypothetical protein n=1 Tax=Streptomyces mirabilis TaxID=68239 RepID=UPI003686ADD3
MARTALYLQQTLRTLAEEVQTPNEKVAEVDGLIEARFRAPEMAEFLVSMPGIGPLLSAGKWCTRLDEREAEQARAMGGNRCASSAKPPKGCEHAN